MTLNREALEERKSKLTQILETATHQTNAIRGALSEVEYWLNKLEEPEKEAEDKA